MPISKQKALPKNTWFQLTAGSSTGSIFHQRGDFPVFYTQSQSKPRAFSKSTPVAYSTVKAQDFVYYGLDSEFVWAWSSGGDSVLTVSESEV